MKKLIFITFPLFIIIVFLSIIQVVVANMLSTAGVELDLLQTDLIKLHKENTLLRETVLSDTSLTKIASTAANMGFADAKTSLYLSDNIPMARR